MNLACIWVICQNEISAASVAMRVAMHLLLLAHGVSVHGSRQIIVFASICKFMYPFKIHIHSDGQAPYTSMTEHLRLHSYRDSD